MRIILWVLFACVLLSTTLARGAPSGFSRSSKLSYVDIIVLYVTCLDMDKMCGTTITLDGDRLPGVFFTLTSNTYADNADCQLTIKGGTLNQRIVVVVDKMDIACEGDHLFIYDGKKESSALLNRDINQQCGKQKYYLRVK
jgi:hypothetical protein